MGIPRIILDNAAALGERRADTTQQNDSGKRQGSHCHSILQRDDLPERPPLIDNPDRDCSERQDHPILHWKVSTDVSYKPARHRALQAGDYDSELTQTLRRDGASEHRRGFEKRTQCEQMESALSK